MTDTQTINATVVGSANTYDQVAIPQCSIDIYPFEGGIYTITGGQILSLSMRKNIKSDMGEITVNLAPGGPNGTELTPSWTEIITPMSFFVLGMRRGQRHGITMVGVVTNISESQVWQPNGSVVRTIAVTGKDFGYFLAMFNYYSLFFLGAAGTELEGSVPTPSAGLPAVINAKLEGTPSSIALSWWNSIIAGPGSVLSQTYVPYKNESTVLFPKAIATLFEDYPVYIPPFGDSFFGTDGSWTAKFRNLFPFPWYEYFINTANNDLYSSLTTFSSGYGFTSSLLPKTVTASPVLVARINPMPILTSSTSDPTGTVVLDGIDTSAWESLILFQPESTQGTSIQTVFPFISSLAGFSESEVYNLFLINPTWFRALWGAAEGGNSSLMPFLFQYSAAGDPASIARYGFRVANPDISWFTDATGQQSESAKTQMGPFLSDILGRFASYYEPSPIMARCSMTLPLRPDIVVGNRFRTKPFKNDVSWDFYIEGIDHNFVFGGPSTTTLTLSRGLPTSVYADSSTTGILYNALKGNAMRQNGKYVIGTPPGTKLKPLSGIPPFAFQSWVAQSFPIYSTAQMVSGATN
ncbi:MAG: hypothetical protein KGJ90_00505 [Patescibacteria group bacterium]|nr:hypothetical protein [Patescibacteria group bacterium]